MFSRETAKCLGPYILSSVMPDQNNRLQELYMSAVEFTDVPEMVRILNINQDVYNGSALFQYPYLESHANDRIQRAHDTILTSGINTHWALRLRPAASASVSSTTTTTTTQTNDASETGATSSWPLIGWAHLHFEHYSDDHDHNESTTATATTNEKPFHKRPVHPITGKPLRVAEIGYWLSPEHTGRGYAAKMGKYLVDEIAFKDMGCDIVRAVSYVENMGSRKVAERAGMILELESKSIWIPKLGVERDVCCYAAHKDKATGGIIKENYDY
ncbi:hypothetical protein BGZ76_005407 [Entomortierella beljakovae]|nr:hypothetical protein BGZ76_005407 [Entomortierella beljakovae]